MKRALIGICLGAIVGVIDVVPMIIMKLTWDANISAFLMWVVIGFLLSMSVLNVHPIIRGLIISYSVLLPSAILIGWSEPISLVPIFLMTTILGATLGIVLNKVLDRFIQ